MLRCNRSYILQCKMTRAKRAAVPWLGSVEMPLSLPPGLELVAATHNAGKARELAALLNDRYHVLNAGVLGLPEPDETESTFMGNALLKARHAADRSGYIALADDSGLSVTALKGAPGIYSARWAGPEKDFGMAMARIERELEALQTQEQAAAFTCALAVAWPNGPAVVVEGQVQGRLSFPGRGQLGFGYDPIFIPDGETQSFAEMDAATKDRLSHRTRAFEQLRAALF